MGRIAAAIDNAKAVLPFSGSAYGMSGARWSFVWNASTLPGELGYGGKVGDGSGSSLFEACIGIIAAAFPEAPLALWRLPAEGQREIVTSDPMLGLMRRPTWDPRKRRTMYGASVMWCALLTSWWISGNAYLVKIRGGGGYPVQLWYVPHWMLEPAWPEDGSAFISHYWYSSDGRSPVKVALEDVIHFRYGVDPNNLRKGYSPITKVLREIYTDEEAARFSATILKNLGVPGLMLSPSRDSKKILSPIEALALKAEVTSKTSGENRGDTVVMTSPTELKTFGFSPDDLNLGGLRNVPEERVSAIMRVPAAIAGFGTGLEGVKVGATMEALRAQLWESNLLPTMRMFAEELYGQLLPDFVLDDRDLDRFEVGFDLTRVSALADIELKKVERWTRLMSAGAVKRKELRIALGLPWAPEDDIYLAQPGVMANPTGEDAPPPTPDEEAAIAALEAVTESGKQLERGIADLRTQVAVLASKSSDGRADPNLIRLIEHAERANDARNTTLTMAVLELGKSIVLAQGKQLPAKVTKTKVTARDSNGHIEETETRELVGEKG